MLHALISPSFEMSMTDISRQTSYAQPDHAGCRALAAGVNVGPSRVVQSWEGVDLMAFSPQLQQYACRSACTVLSFLLCNGDAGPTDFPSSVASTN